MKESGETDFNGRCLLFSLDDRVFSADRTEATVIPGAAQRGPGIQEIRRSAWVRSFRGNDEKNLIIEYHSHDKPEFRSLCPG